MPTKSYTCIYITILLFCIHVLVGPPLPLVVVAVFAVAVVAVAGNFAVQDGFESRLPPILDPPNRKHLLRSRHDMSTTKAMYSIHRLKQKHTALVCLVNLSPPLHPYRQRPSVAAAKKTAAMRLLHRLQRGGHGIVRLVSSSRPTKLHGKNM